MSFPGPYTNNKIEVFRCKMEDAQTGYMELARGNEEMTVEIFREDDSLVKFNVPWKTRVQSKYLVGPPDTKEHPLGSSRNPRASTFDPWKGFDRNTPGVWTRDKLHLCIPGIESVPSKKVSTVHASVCYCCYFVCIVIYNALPHICL